MADYRLFGADTSPYSQKVAAFLRYKGIAFDWVARGQAAEAEFKALAKVASVPLLVSPGRPASQDSTAMLKAIEADHADPSATPDDPACAALALILEDYGDEWLNKCMFQQRWSQMPDKDAAALRVLTQLYDGKPPRAKKKAKEQIAGRMADRLSLVGAQSDNWNTLETSYRRFCLRLNTHLTDHLYIFGGAPSFADFSLAAQLQQMMMDPTPAEWMRDRAPFVTAWCENMEDPRAGGPFASLADLKGTLAPLFEGEVAKTYLPWAVANAASAGRRTDHFSVTLEDGLFEQSTQRYAGSAYDGVRQTVKQAAKDTPDLHAFLEETAASIAFSRGR